ncbi:DNA breaking-rejoining protein [Massilia dura]|uniref:DNA breaking-rejoining protein n=1 Tax=Pseudoduganella dura TaxID=321982 RepID=A0A6I3X674_9BURK|nr:DNA breaking-rejoining protein [Pseudoduganella dura]MUI11737.1 DNA breaking-rejoining protein [Pseudoduganella dura]GGX78719.1 hypothetical protein GCM10007386_07160 [Pseudoduganella dura]
MKTEANHSALAGKRVLAAGVALCGLLAGLQQSAAAADKVETHTIDASTPGTKLVRGKIRGYGSAEYKVQVRQGQMLAVGLKTNSRSNYFNVTAPGAQEALFNGSIDGLDYRGKAEQGGEYTVNVYLMRNAARRNESANYTLSVGTQK